MELSRQFPTVSHRKEQGFGRNIPENPKISGPEYCFDEIAGTDCFLAVLSDLGICKKQERILSYERNEDS